MALSKSTVPSNDVRLPQPEAGTAVVVERYGSGQVKAVILHPEDFDRLQAGAEALEELAAVPAAALTDLAARAHREAEAPQGPLVEDRASVKRLLGL